METFYDPVYMVVSKSSYPTYEEWKPLICYSHLLQFLVLILPMRNGNNKLATEFNTPYMVLILPMRNGNLNLLFRAWLLIAGSYPTYEEWKLISILPKDQLN